MTDTCEHGSLVAHSKPAPTQGQDMSEEHYITNEQRLAGSTEPVPWDKFKESVEWVERHIAEKGAINARIIVGWDENASAPDIRVRYERPETDHEALWRERNAELEKAERAEYERLRNKYERR